MLQKKTVLIYFILILIGTGFIAYGSWSLRRGNMPELSEAQKLAELEAVLATGKAKESESKRTKRTAAARPSRLRST